jgi:hypothetical protein
MQLRLYRRILLPKLIPSSWSHGGVRGRDIKTNAAAHRGSAFIFKTDISQFYPTIHRSRVYRLFVADLKCSPDVARLCTRLCTYKHHLALGLITSPILAELALRRADARIAVACARAGLVFTRYVDDIAISGTFDLKSSGFPQLVAQILSDSGFQTNFRKNKFGSLSKHFAIANVRIIRGRLDVRKEYAEELQRQLDDARRLSLGQQFDGPYYTRTQIRGRVHFVGWVNPRRLPHLLRQYKSISWSNVAARAQELGLVELRKTFEECPRL